MVPGYGSLSKLIRASDKWINRIMIQISHWLLYRRRQEGNRGKLGGRGKDPAGSWQRQLVLTAKATSPPAEAHFWHVQCQHHRPVLTIQPLPKQRNQNSGPKHLSPFSTYNGKQLFFSNETMTLTCSPQWSWRRAYAEGELRAPVTAFLSSPPKDPAVWGPLPHFTEEESEASGV